MVIPFMMAGVGMALYFAPSAHVVLGAVARRDEGKASGAANAIRELGGVFGVAVLGTIFSTGAGTARHSTSSTGWSPPWRWAPWWSPSAQGSHWRFRGGGERPSRPSSQPELRAAA